MIDLTEHQVQVAGNGETVWIHALDGSTVGRFSKTFGMDVHRTVEDQLAGAAQCLHCTYEKPSEKDWGIFCDLMKKHYDIEVNKSLVQFK